MGHLKPTVDILLRLSTSGVLGEGIGLVRHTNTTLPLCATSDSYLFFLVEVSTSKCDICWCWSLTSSACLLSCPSIRDRSAQVSQAAEGVSTSYDALVELFECFEHYLGRLKIFTEIPSAVEEVLVKIMVELLGVLALAVQQIKQGRFSAYYLVYTRPWSNDDTEKFAKKLLGENDIEAVLQRLDRLTIEESRMTAAQTMQVVLGLFNNMKTIIDGMQFLSNDVRYGVLNVCRLRWKDINGWHSNGSR